MADRYPGIEFVARPVMGGSFALLMANAGVGCTKDCRDLKAVTPRAVAGKDGTMSIEFKA